MTVMYRINYKNIISHTSTCRGLIHVTDQIHASLSGPLISSFSAILNSQLALTAEWLFSVNVPELCNSLPRQIRSINSLTSPLLTDLFTFRLALIHSAIFPHCLMVLLVVQYVGQHLLCFNGL